MILHKMAIENFRQFKGRHEIEFAGGNSANASACITVFFGENGRGKTGIFRALMFGLYGERRLSQDDQAKQGELCLVNLHLLETDPSETVTAAVELEFSHKGKRYTLRRELLGGKHNGTVHEELGPLLLRIQDEAGNTTPCSDPNEVRQRINEVLDYRVREYFLFDGEKIERLTRANADQRKEVSAGIRNLLNIDDLEKSIRACSKLCRSLDQQIKDKSTGELGQIIHKMNSAEDCLKEKQDNVRQFDDEIAKAIRQKKEVDEQLEKYQEIRELVDERHRLEEEKLSLQEVLLEMERECRKQIPRLPFGVMRPVLQDVFDTINARMENGDIPPLVRSDLIQELLSKKTCICGRSLDEGSEPYKKLLECMAKTPNTMETDAALQIWRHLNKLIDRIDIDRQEAENLLIQCSDAEDRLQSIARRLEGIAELIGAGERSDAAKLEDVRERIEQDQIAYEAKKLSLQEEIAEIQRDLSDLKRDRQRLEEDEAVRNSLVRRSQLAQKIHDALTAVFESFRSEVANQIGIQATTIMQKILDNESRRNLREIIVQEDYSLQIISRWEGQFLANISAGQRQIMSIAFITALARAAAGDEVLEMPLFMDTPFGRLSTEHRNNLIRIIPDLSSQWVLLATDTELRREEGQILLGEKRLGRFYRLVSQKDGTTKIVEQKLEDVPVLLNATKEK